MVLLTNISNSLLTKGKPYSCSKCQLTCSYKYMTLLTTYYMQLITYSTVLIVHTGKQKKMLSCTYVEKVCRNNIYNIILRVGLKEENLISLI